MPSSILGVKNSTPFLDYKGTQGKFVWKIWKNTLASLLSRIADAATLILLFYYSLIKCAEKHKWTS